MCFHHALAAALRAPGLLLASGELQRRLIDGPSRPMALGSKVLGLALIAMGSTLLVLVAAGFFGGAGGR